MMPEPFEPPKYIASLIAAINDGAKTAQTGALAFSAVGLYLIAAALSTTDEDLLLEHTTSIAQLGVQVPVVFTFAMAPFVFVALHASTLIRYDMLAANLRQFRDDLDAMVRPASDRERCRQLLANVEFVIAQGVPRNSPLHNRFFRWVWFGVVAIFPVIVFLIVQVRGLRYQSYSVVLSERAVIVSDLVLLVWFFHRQWLAEISGRVSDIARLRLWIALLLAVGIVSMDFAWLNIPQLGQGQTPYDLIACHPSSSWGCRFLRVDHRTLVGHVWRGEAIADLRAGRGDKSAALAAVEGLFLRNRTLRLADFSESRLYNADLIGANLSRADLSGAHLSSTHLSQADLIGANLSGADLGGANLSRATLMGADLIGANLSGADLSDAHLSDANLNQADLNGAHLSHADLSRADLGGAHLSHAHLRGADLSHAHLSQADLSQADLIGADLSGADLGGTNLSRATLSGVDLTRTKDINQSQLDAACGTDVKPPQGMTFKDRPCPHPEYR